VTALQFLKSRPGRYAVSDSGFDVHGNYYMVEADAEGNIYELTPDGKRAGPPLSDDKWNPDIRVYHVSENADLFVRLA